MEIYGCEFDDERIEFFVQGQARPAGSKNGFALKKGGVYTGRVAMADVSGEKGKTWRQDVKEEARKHFDRPTDKPVTLTVIFMMQRPKAHYRSGKYAQKLKPSAPTRHVQKPDTTKLTRSLEDALTGIAWVDDCQVYSIESSKLWACRFTETAGAKVFVQYEKDTTISNPTGSTTKDVIQ